MPPPPSPRRSAILVFVRAPEAGRVKTRLSAEIGAAAALRVYVRLAEHALAEARRTGAEVRVHFTPADAEAEVRRWLGSPADYLAQGEGDLGERLRRAFDRAFADGCERVVVIGSDLPGLSAEGLRRALELLEERGAVLGPAHDGGYYLLGLRAPAPGVFEGIPWSTERVLACTLDRLRAAGLEPALLEPLRDVDRVEDLPPGWRAWAEG